MEQKLWTKDSSDDLEVVKEIDVIEHELVLGDLESYYRHARIYYLDKKDFNVYLQNRAYEIVLGKIKVEGEPSESSPRKFQKLN